jgi:DNA-binding MarR family transcriptional regulator
MDKAATAKGRSKTKAGDTGREAWGLLSSLVYPPPFLPLVRELDLRPATFAALRLLEQARTMSQLADLLHCDNSNVTGIVDNLEERDLAIRYPSEVDRRIKVVELTVKGEILMRRVRRELAKPPEWVKDLSAEDQAQLRSILQRAADARNA